MRQWRVVRDDYSRPMVKGHEFIKQYRSFTSMLCNGIVGRPPTPLGSNSLILARSAAEMPGK
jgi:hypothetical protein